MAEETPRTTPPWKTNTYRYIPDERTSQEKLTKQIASLSQIAHLKTFFDAALEAMFILNSDWQIVYTSRHMLKAVGTDDESTVLGRRPGEVLNCEHATECSGVCGNSRACAVCGGVIANRSGLMGKEKIAECRMARFVGGYRESFDYRVESTPLVHDGENYAIVALADVSGEKRRKQYEEVFLQDILREVYTLDTYTYQLGNELPRPNRPPTLDLVFAQIAHIVDQILSQHDLAKAEKGALSIIPTRLVPYDFIYTLAKEYKNRAEQHGVSIEIDPFVSGCMFYSDITVLRRILGNLLMNAIEATERGGAVILSATNTGDDKPLVFSVHNEGVIPEEVQVQLFNRSFSTKSPNRGLGAYTARLLAESYLKGAVYFSSDYESGTTFFVELPLNLDGTMPPL